MANSDVPLLRQYQETLERKLSADIDFARSLIKHQGERGRVVELMFKSLLECHLPESFGVTTGFAIDQHSNLSKQLDLVVYDKSHCPFLFNQGVAILPVEAVILAVEVKTKLNKAEFNKSRETARSILKLDRSAYVTRTSRTPSPFEDGQGRHMPLLLVASLDSVDTKELFNSVKGQLIEPIFISMDGRCLLNGIGPSGTTQWEFKIDYPAAMFVLLASMLVTQSRIPPIDVSKYLKVLPVQ